MGLFGGEVKVKDNNISVFIGEGTKITGDLSIKGSIHVDGLIQGSVMDGENLIIGASGVISGDVNMKHAVVSGKVVGNVSVHKLDIKKNGFIKGDIHAKSLSIEDGASFSGKCFMDIEKAENEVKSKLKDTSKAKETAK